MRNVFETVKILPLYWFYWVLDYIYVGYWQLRGFIQRGDRRLFLAPPQSRPTPVILIPGIYERWEFMKPIAQTLFGAHYAVHVVEGLGYNRGDIETMATVVDQYIREQNLRDCVIVAHSKGGLIGKYLLMNQKEAGTFRGLIAINTPFSGSPYATVFPLKSVRIFSPRSAILGLLAANTLINERVVSIYSRFDPHIPQGSFLEGAQNIQLPMYGHFRIIKDKRLHVAVLEALEKLR